MKIKKHSLGVKVVTVSNGFILKFDYPGNPNKGVEVTKDFSEVCEMLKEFFMEEEDGRPF